MEVDNGPPLGNVKIGHAIINISYGIKVESEENPCKRVVLRANFQGIRDEMNKEDWDSTQNGLGVEEAYSRFLCGYNNLWKEYVPIKGNANSIKRGEWRGKDTLNMVKQKHKMWYKIRSDTDKAK